MYAGTKAGSQEFDILAGVLHGDPPTPFSSLRSGKPSVDESWLRALTDLG